VSSHLQKRYDNIHRWRVLNWNGVKLTKKVLYSGRTHSQDEVERTFWKLQLTLDMKMGRSPANSTKCSKDCKSWAILRDLDTSDRFQYSVHKFHPAYFVSTLVMSLERHGWQIKYHVAHYRRQPKFRRYKDRVGFRLNFQLHLRKTRNENDTVVGQQNRNRPPHISKHGRTNLCLKLILREITTNLRFQRNKRIFWFCRRITPAVHWISYIKLLLN
jgi:hypothetical protein